MNYIEKKMMTVILKAESAIKNAENSLKSKLKENTAEGYMDTLIKILISVVLGVALLAALKLLILDKLFPELEEQILAMFTGNSDAGAGGTPT